MIERIYVDKVQTEILFPIEKNVPIEKPDYPLPEQLIIQFKDILPIPEVQYIPKKAKKLPYKKKK